MARLESITGKAISGEWGLDDEEGTGIPVLRTTNFTNEGIIDFSDVVTRTITKKDLSLKYLRPGDIIIEKSGGSDKQPVGRVVYYSGDKDTYLFNNFTGVLRVIDSSCWDSKYLFYALHANYQKGGTRKYQNKTTGLHNLKTDQYVKEFEVQERPVQEQRQIVIILDGVCNLISLRKQQLAKLDELVKARFVEMFGTENEFNKWPGCTIGDIADVCVGVVIKPTQYYTDNGVPAFRSLNVGEMRVKDLDWVYFTQEGHQKNQKSIIRKNDVLVVRSGAPGTACIASEKYAGYNAIDIIIAHPDNTKINSAFLAMFTNLPHGMAQIKEKTGGAAQQHFNVSGYKSLRVILPPLDYQNKFGVFVKQTDKMRLTVQQSLDKLELAKKSLMQQYFG